MLTWTLQLFKAEKASKPGTQDTTMPWAVWLRTRRLAGAEGIPAGKSQGKSAGGRSPKAAPPASPRQPPVRAPAQPWLQLQEAAHLQDGFARVLYWGALWVASRQWHLWGNTVLRLECREFPPFPMENCGCCPGCEGRKRVIQPFRHPLRAGAGSSAFKRAFWRFLPRR